LWYNGGMDKDVVLRAPNRCISCAYLCYLEGYTYCEVVNNSRKEIINKNLARSLCPRLKCYKNYLLDMYNSFTGTEAEEAMAKVSQAICPRKEWHLHQDGITPEVSYQHEQHSKSQRRTKIGISISIITLIAVIVFSALQLRGCSW